MPASNTPFPLTDHLWQIGFTLSFTVDRLAAPIVVEDATFYCQAKLRATPDRGEARRRFGRKGAIEGTAYCNLELEVFAAEREAGTTELKDRYMEVCSRNIFDLLLAEDASVSRPEGGYNPLAGSQDTASPVEKGAYGLRGA